jgi:hypothetical protein
MKAVLTDMVFATTILISGEDEFVRIDYSIAAVKNVFRFEPLCLEDCRKRYIFLRTALTATAIRTVPPLPCPFLLKFFSNIPIKELKGKSRVSGVKISLYT